jgi:hypothetical protein
MTHSRGLKVFLRPTLEFYYWAEPRIFLEPTDWNAWFQSYENFINHYANIAQQTEVELFAVGNELWYSERHTQKWKDIISKVRNIYTGLLTYSSMALEYVNQQIPSAEFWDVLNFIGIDDYTYITGNKYGWNSGFESMLDPSYAIFIRTLEKHLDEILLPLHQKFNKPILITESGCGNYDGANQDPGFYFFSDSMRIDNDEQAKYIEAMLQTISQKDWIKGFFVFYHQLEADFNFQIRNIPFQMAIKDRPVGGVIKFWYK